MINNLFLISSAPEIASAFSKILNILLNIKGQIISPEEGFPYGNFDKSVPVVLAGCDDGEINKWYWEKIRSSQLNPVIVLGYSMSPSFLQQNPVFKTRYHRYIEPPWSLPEIFNAIEEVVPLHDEATRQILYHKYGGYVLDRINVLIGHDLNNPDAGKNLATLEDALRLSMKLNDDRLEGQLKAAIELRMDDDLDGFRKLRAEIIDYLKSS